MKEVKDYISSNVGEEFIITVDKEKKSKKVMRCIVKEVYSSLFLVEVINEEFDKIKTFTYSEVHCNAIEMVKA